MGKVSQCLFGDDKPHTGQLTRSMITISASPEHGQVSIGKKGKEKDSVSNALSQRSGVKGIRF